MTVQDVIDYVRSIIITPQNGYLDDEDDLIPWINAGIKEFYSSEGIEGRFKYPAVNGDTIVPFTPNIIRVVDLYVVDEKGEKHDIDEADYYIFGNEIHFYDKNEYDGYYYVEAFYLPQDVAQKTDAINIPAVFEDAIKKYALAQAYLKDENYRLYEQQISLFYNKVKAYRAFNRKVNERKYIEIKKEF